MKYFLPRQKNELFETPNLTMIHAYRRFRAHGPPDKSPMTAVWISDASESALSADSCVCKGFVDETCFRR